MPSLSLRRYGEPWQHYTPALIASSIAAGLVVPRFPMVVFPVWGILAVALVVVRVGLLGALSTGSVAFLIVRALVLAPDPGGLGGEAFKAALLLLTITGIAAAFKPGGRGFSPQIAWFVSALAFMAAVMFWRNGSSVDGQYAAWLLYVTVPTILILLQKLELEPVFRTIVFVGMFASLLTFVGDFGEHVLPIRTDWVTSSPIWIARAIAIALVSATVFLKSNSSRILALCLMGTALAMLNELGPLLGAAAGILAIFLSNRRKGHPTVSFCRLSATIFAGGIGLLLTWQRIVAALAGDHSVQVRLSLYKLAWRQFTSHPLLGTGVGSFTVDLSHELLVYPHNVFLEALSEMGLVGFVAYATLFALSTLALLRVPVLRPIAVTVLIFTMVSGDIPSNYELFCLGALALSTSNELAQGRVK